MRRVPRVALAATLLLALLAGFFATTEIGGMVMLHPLEAGARAPTSDELREVQAIALLGGRTMRVRTAGQLYRQTRLPLLVTGRGTGDRGFAAESQRMAAILQHDYGAQVRWLETQSIDTEENAAFSWCLVHADRVRRIALVTDPAHMRRASLAFEAVGFQVVPVPALDGYLGIAPVNWASFIPSRKGRRLAWTALRQWLGMAMVQLDPPSPHCAGPGSSPPGA